jgi:hypothetical protein
MRPLLIIAMTLAAAAARADESGRLAALVDRLAGGDEQQSREASAELATMGPPALAELKRAAASGDGVLSERAKQAIELFWNAGGLVPESAAPVLRDIREEHDRLTAAGKEAEAERLASAWTELRGEIAGFRVASVEGAAPEVHAVGFDRGRVEGARAARAEVEVSRTGAPVVLVLSGKERVRWDVKLAEGADLRMVIVTGPESQVVRGVPEGVPVVRRIGSEGAPFAHSTSAADESFAGFAKSVSEWAGGEVMSLQGGETWDGRPVQVGTGNPTWGFERARARVARLHREAAAATVEARRRAAGALRFLAVSHVLDHGDGLGPADFAPEQVLAGTLRRTPRPINHLALDPELGVLYAVSSRGAFSTTREARNLEDLVPGDGDDVPDLERPCGVGFDHRRRRVAILTAGEVGTFAVYEPAARRWEARQAPARRTLSGLAYAAAEDAFYSVETPPDARSTSTLLKLSPDGAVLGALRLSRPFPCRAGRPEQIACVPTPDAPDGARFRIVLLGAPLLADRDSLVRHCFVVEPESGRVELAAEQDARVSGE